MADVETIATGMAGRYASALFTLAREQRAIDRTAEDLNGFVGLIRESDDLRRLVRSPAFTADEQVRALGQILDRANIHGITANFLKLLAVKRRLFAIEAMVKDFNALDDADKGVIRAKVTVAEPISDAQRADLQHTLSDISGKSVEMAVVVDPDIIGGLVVQIGSRMIDGSVRTKLNSIRTRMKEVA